MPPKKHKTNIVSSFSSDYAAMTPNGIIDTNTDIHKDPFSYPNVMTMAITKLKSELNRLQVCIVRNQAKTTLQAKLLTAYQEELLDKVVKFYRNYYDSHYRVLRISKSKSCVYFGCTCYQVIAPGVVSNPPWTVRRS